jgi:hypothetical protein
MTTLDQLRREYGHDWTIRERPRPGATRRRQLDADPDRPSEFYLAMTLWADSIDDLSRQLAEQSRLLASQEAD